MEYIKPTLPIHEFPSGVYKLIFNDKWFYIGSSQDIKKRFIRWRVGFRKPERFIPFKKIREILPDIYKVEQVVLKLCDDYKEQEWRFIKKDIKSPFLLNARTKKKRANHTSKTSAYFNE